MTKKEIVKVIADELRIPQQTVKEVVAKTFESIINTLVEEGRIELRNFGVFVVKLRKRRNARNPKTNAPVQVEAKKVVTFQPGKLMEKEVRNAKKVQETKRRGKPKKPLVPPPLPTAVPTAEPSAESSTSTSTPQPAPKPRLPKKQKPTPVPEILPALPEITATPQTPPTPKPPETSALPLTEPPPTP